MNKLKDLFIILPAFNKQDEIEETVCRLKKVLQTIDFSYQLIVVDDGSQDRTLKIMLESAHFRDAIIVVHSQNEGKGAAVRSGFKAVHGNPRYVGYLDADLDLDPGALPMLLSFLEDSACEVAIGSKVHKDSVVFYPTSRRFFSKIFSLITKFFLRVSVKDSQTGMKIFRWDLLSEDLKSFKSNGFLFDLEVLSMAHERGCRILEGPIKLNYQFSSTLSFRKVAGIMFDLTAIILRKNLHFKSVR